jgi:hypothetical protein
MNIARKIHGIHIPFLLKNITWPFNNKGACLHYYQSLLTMEGSTSKNGWDPWTTINQNSNTSLVFIWFSLNLFTLPFLLKEVVHMYMFMNIGFKLTMVIMGCKTSKEKNQWRRKMICLTILWLHIQKTLLGYFICVA